MKAFRERFKQHPLQASLSDLWTAIEQVRLPKYSEGEVSDDLETLRTRRDAFARFLRVSSFVAQTIGHTDPSIWTPSAMNVAQATVNQLKAGLDQFNATRAIAHLESAADTALDQFRGAFIPRLKIKSKEAADSFAKFCEKAEETIRSLEEQDRAIKDKEIEISKAHEAFTSQIAELGAQIEAFKTQFEAQKSRVDDLVTTQSQAFQTSQTERSNLFTQESDIRKQSLQDWTKGADEKLDALLKATQTSADEHLAEMEKHKARAKEILGIVAASGVSGHYKNTATRELISAETLRVLALICFGVMGYVIYHVVESLTTPNFRWEMGLFRVGVGLALLVPAYYCAKESAKHREAEKRNRRLQIELATIEPYLEKLNDDPAMREILKQKADSYFMGQNHREPDDDLDGSKSSREQRRFEDRMMELMKTAITTIAKR
ncbi:MAG: hypothetical protein RLZZ398_210 [Verrucomicrobiota bacterium]|jgi:hypothetical protein